MTAPFTPVWCSEALVVDWLKMSVVTPADAELITLCAASVEPEVEQARPDQFVEELSDPDDPASPLVRVYRPDAQVTRTAVMLAAKVFRRRNSPGGMETSFDQVLYVARFDPEIQKGLRQGPYRRPAVDTPPPGPYTYAGVW